MDLKGRLNTGSGFVKEGMACLSIGDRIPCMERASRYCTGNIWTKMNMQKRPVNGSLKTMIPGFGQKLQKKQGSNMHVLLHAITTGIACGTRNILIIQVPARQQKGIL